MKKIYCIEDDTNIRELMEYALTSTNFLVTGFEDSTKFFTTLETQKPDLILLDIMLPGKDGLEILKELRANAATKKIPIIMLTAKTSPLDKIKGLDSGADDYITKPFDIMELISRINAVLRRCDSDEKETLTYKNITIEPDSRIVTANEQPLTLTYKEFELLYYLISNKGIVLSRDKLMNEIWGVDFEGESRTVDVHIRTLRQKLGNCGEYIETVRNVGYKIG